MFKVVAAFSLHTKDKLAEIFVQFLGFDVFRISLLVFFFLQNFPLAVERDSAHAGSTIQDCMLSYKSDFILHNSTLHVPFYDRFQSN